MTMIECKRTTFTQLELAGSAIIDRQDVQRAGEILTKALADGGQATLLIDLRAVEDMTMRALAQDASLGARLKPMPERVRGVALVGVTDWLAPLSSWQEATMPTLRVRRFAASDIDGAHRWLMDGAEPAPNPNLTQRTQRTQRMAGRPTKALLTRAAGARS